MTSRPAQRSEWDGIFFFVYVIPCSSPAITDGKREQTSRDEVASGKKIEAVGAAEARISPAYKGKLSNGNTLKQKPMRKMPLATGASNGKRAAAAAGSFCFVVLPRC